MARSWAGTTRCCSVVAGGSHGPGVSLAGCECGETDARDLRCSDERRVLEDPRGVRVTTEWWRGGGEDPWLRGPGFRRVCVVGMWTLALGGVLELSSKLRHITAGGRSCLSPYATHTRPTAAPSGGSGGRTQGRQRRSFSGQVWAKDGREAGSDARKVAHSQQVVENACRGRRTLDQESPGSSPGGAIGSARRILRRGAFRHLQLCVNRAKREFSEVQL
jgi:hypothetical protein